MHLPLSLRSPASCSRKPPVSSVSFLPAGSGFLPRDQVASSRRFFFALLVLGLLGSQVASASVDFQRRAGVHEGGGFVELVFTRSGSLAGAEEVAAFTRPGSASPGVDYGVVAERLRWEDGEGGPRTLRVPILDDAVLEEPEFFAVEVETRAADGVVSGGAVRVQISDNEPPPRPPERQLADVGSQPAVAAESGGRGLVVYGGREGITGALLDADGLPVGDPFLLRDGRDGPVDAPTVAADARGRFFVAWRRVAEGPPPPSQPMPRSAIEGQVVDSTGAVLGPPIELSQTYDGIVGPPRIGTNTTGESVVVFTDGLAVLRGRVLPPEEILGAGTPSRPPVDIDFGILAEDYRVSTVRDRAFAVIAETPEDQLGRVGVSIAVRTWTLDGAPTRSPVALSTDGTATSPAVSRGPDGRIVAAWSEEGPDGDLDVKVAFLDDGQDLEEGSLVEVGGPGDQTQPRVSTNSSGDAILVWLDRPSSSARAGRIDTRIRTSSGGAEGGSSIVARSFDPGGQSASEDVVVAETEDETEPVDPEVVIEDDDDATVVFERVETDGGESAGIYSATLETTVAAGACTEDAQTLCLNDGRFEVIATWASDSEQGAAANGEAITDDTGYFWFFDEDNVEIVVKVLDACGVNDRFWVFAGGLTDVEVNLTVTDTQSGVSLLYVNELGTSYLPVQDTSAFDTCDDGEAAQWSSLRSRQRRDEDRRGSDGSLEAAPGAAVEGAAGVCPVGSLCLGQDRFELSLEFETSGGSTGDGQPLALTDDTGYFWFFDEDNVEVVVKVLDACGFNSRYWVFAAGLTNVETTLTVRDTESGEMQVYENPQSTPFQPITDTDAFASCN